MQMRKLGHVPALDALRGIAIALVLVHHSSFLPGGTLGVDLFFVLSGFLITSLLLTEWGRTSRIGLGAFYRRRVLRLFPALFTVIAMYVIAAGLIDLFGLREDLFRRTVISAAFGLFYVANITRAADAFQGYGFEHLWTLATEEQFYLLWPPLLLLALRAGARPRTIALALAGLALLVMAWRTTLIQTGAPMERAWFAPDVRADTILLGCLAGVVYSYRLVAVPGWVATVALIPACAMVTVNPWSNNLLPTIPVTLFALACALVVLQATEGSWWFASMIDRRPLRGLGRISYGVYLWHVPIFVALGWKIGIPASIAIALLSYRYVERPFLRMKRRAALPPDQRSPGTESLNAGASASAARA